MAGPTYDQFDNNCCCNGTGRTKILGALCKFLFTFGAGVYAGIYVSQNYEVPRVDDPPKLIEKINQKIRDMVDEHKKKTAAEQLIHDVKKSAKKIIED